MTTASTQTCNSISLENTTACTLLSNYSSFFIPPSLVSPRLVNNIWTPILTWEVGLALGRSPAVSVRSIIQYLEGGGGVM